MPVAITLIRRWFSAVPGAGGPVLPDGWHRKPFDSSVELDSGEAKKGYLELHFTDDLTIYLYPPFVLAWNSGRCVFTAYVRARLFYGDAVEPRENFAFDHGAIEFFSSSTDYPSGIVSGAVWVMDG